MRYAVYVNGPHGRALANLVPNGEEYEHLFGDRHFTRLRYFTAAPHSDGLLLIAASVDDKDSKVLTHLKGKEERTKCQFSPQASGLTLKVCGSTTVKPRFLNNVGGRRALLISLYAHDDETEALAPMMVSQDDDETEEELIAVDAVEHHLDEIEGIGESVADDAKGFNDLLRDEEALRKMARAARDILNRLVESDRLRLLVAADGRLIVQIAGWRSLD